MSSWLWTLFNHTIAFDEGEQDWLDQTNVWSINQINNLNLMRMFVSVTS